MEQALEREGQRAGFPGPGRWVPALLDVRYSVLTPSEGWATPALLLAVHLVVLFAIQSTHWVDPMPRLWLVGILALFVGMWLGKVRGPLLLQLSWHLAALALGAGIVLMETAGTLSGAGLGEKLNELFARLDGWLGAVGSQGISNDRLPFALMLAGGAWLMAFFSSWFTFRFQWGWPAVILPTIGLLTNQSYLPNSRYPLPLLFLLLFSILFMSRLHFLGRARLWRSQGVKQMTRRFAFLANALVLTLLVLAIAWAIPTRKVVLSPLKDTYATARGPWVQLEGEFERLFAGVPSKKAGALHSFGLALPLRGAVGLGASEVFSVTTDFASYWRGQSYDYYLGQGWLSHQDQRESVKADELASYSKGGGYLKQEIVAQRVQLKSSSGIIFAAGQPLEVSVPSALEVAVPRVYRIALDGARQADELPPDLAEAAQKVRASRGSLAEMQRLLPPESKIIREQRGFIWVTREAPATPDILAIKSSSRLKPASSYEVLSALSIATAVDLQRDRTLYPRWVADNFLQLPATLPARIRTLAQDVTKNATNPYDKAVAIEEYLRGYEESFHIEAPPLNADAVDYFLFEQKAGYSDYFSSAMAVLLRAVGVPARLATGYSTGVWDKVSSSFTVRQSDAHSWPEVYFPSYGWITFEPSPHLNPIARGPLPGQAGLGDATSAEGDQSLDFLDDFFLDQLLQDDFVLPQSERPIGDLFRSIGVKAGLAVASLAGAFLAAFLVLVALWQVNFIGLPYASGAYARMAKLGGVVWEGPKHAQTPAEYAASLSSAVGLKPNETGAIADGFMKARYGGRQVSAAERDRIQQAWRGVRASLIRRLAQKADLRQLLRREG